MLRHNLGSIRFILPALPDESLFQNMCGTSVGSKHSLGLPASADQLKLTLELWKRSVREWRGGGKIPKKEVDIGLSGGSDSFQQKLGYKKVLYPQHLKWMKELACKAGGQSGAGFAWTKRGSPIFKIDMVMFLISFAGNPSLV